MPTNVIVPFKLPHTLHFAICSQVYNAETNKFVCRNKYYGRRLSKEGLRKGLRDFLYNGHRVRYELIPLICQRLRFLIDIVTRQNSLRFYSSSLLIMYEGHMGSASVSEESGGETAPSVGIKMIDFANTYHRGQHTNKNKGTTGAPLHSGPDKGYIYGLENLLEMLQNLEMTQESSRKSERLSKDLSSTGTGASLSHHQQSCSGSVATESSSNTGMELTRERLKDTEVSGASGNVGKSIATDSTQEQSRKSERLKDHAASGSS